MDALSVAVYEQHRTYTIHHITSIDDEPIGFVLYTVHCALCNTVDTSSAPPTIKIAKS